ncbi:hypothetical protein FFLO_05877 [Filobasidium floriforme]|uniref:Ketoreductase (KR) domain-containing protein n=1 Tax=Filobasidium floriforme TaxID=5210 RepID=A0A8K0NQZ7_9TREE|nr:hypothetical protein FFLO_05877 [Filobasidium floriforme]
MSTAIIQGATGGLGLPLVKLLLEKTQLNVIALTSKSKPSSSASSSSSSLSASSKILSHPRVKLINSVDLLDEQTVQRAADEVKDILGGKKDVRLVVCLAGQLHPEKSLAQLDPSTALQSLALNSLGHLLLYKHILQFVPTSRQFQSQLEDLQEIGDPARGWIRPDGGVWLSTSARVGSIGDNRKGGWYSYRASKAALNQMIRTLDHELVMKKSSALVSTRHPGTTLTSFTRPIIGSPEPDPSRGLFTPEEGALKMLEMIQRARRGDVRGETGEMTGHGGGFYDWKGERVEW